MVRGMVGVFVCHFTRSVIPPANRQTLTHRVESVEHGKPNCLHLSMESDPQGKPTGKWVEEVGESECCSVVEQIRDFLTCIEGALWSATKLIKC